MNIIIKSKFKCYKTLLYRRDADQRVPYEFFGR